MVNGNALLKVGSIRLPAFNYPALPLGHICVFFFKSIFIQSCFHLLTYTETISSKLHFTSTRPMCSTSLTKGGQCVKCIQIFQTGERI